MKTSFKLTGRLLFTFAFLNLCFLYAEALGQTPQDVPKASDSEPLNLDEPAEFITFILIPILLILLFFWLRRRKRKR